MKSQSIKTAVIILSLAFAASCAGKKSKTETTTAPATTASTPAKTDAAPAEQKVADKKSKGKKLAAAKKETATETASGSSKAGTLTCKSGSESRTIEVAGVNGGCETRYTRSGETKTVANAKSGTDYCEQVSGKIKGNLETAGYKCE